MRPSGSRTAPVLIATMTVAFGASVSGHRLDELLQAARIAVERDRVQLEMSLTPGTVVAEGLIREIDADRNGVLSQDEKQAYAGRVLSALALNVDDSPLRLGLAAAHFPDLAALRAGDGAIVIRSQADVSRLGVGRHRLVFRNENAPANSVYLANALVPDSDQVAVTGQQREGDQRELTIDFVVRGSAAPSRRSVWIGVVGAVALALALLRRTGALIRGNG